MGGSEGAAEGDVEGFADGARALDVSPSSAIAWRFFEKLKTLVLNAFLSPTTVVEGSKHVKTRRRSEQSAEYSILGVRRRGKNQNLSSHFTAFALWPVGRKNNKRTAEREQ